MSTTMPKAQNITRKWYVIDAADKPLGRTAAKAADLLRGKHKPIFAPHVDCGDHVIIINAEKAVLTGKKLVQKVHYHHSGWIGGMKEIRYDKLIDVYKRQADTSGGRRGCASPAERRPRRTPSRCAGYR